MALLGEFIQRDYAAYMPTGVRIRHSGRLEGSIRACRLKSWKRWN